MTGKEVRDAGAGCYHFCRKASSVEASEMLAALRRESGGLATKIDANRAAGEQNISGVIIWLLLTSRAETNQHG